MKYKHSVIMFLFMYVWFYLIGCFINISFDVTSWTADSRVGLSTLGTVVTFIVTAIVFIKQNERNL